MMRDHVSGNGTTLSVPGIQMSPGEKEKVEDDLKRPEEHSLVMTKRKILNGGKKSTKFGGPKDRMMASIRVVFTLTSPTKVQAKTFTKAKAEERIKQGKTKKDFFLNPDSQPQKHPMKKDMARPGTQTIGLPVTGLMIPGL